MRLVLKKNGSNDAIDISNVESTLREILYRNRVSLYIKNMSILYEHDTNVRYNYYQFCWCRHELLYYVLYNAQANDPWYDKCHTEMPNLVV